MATRSVGKEIAAVSPQSGHTSMSPTPPRLPFHPDCESLYGVSPSVWRALVDAIFPAARTTDGVLLALSYCRARGLDPFKRMVHIVPQWNSALGREVDSVWPSIGEHRATATRTGSYAGCDQAAFGPQQRMAFKGRLRQRGREEFKDEEVGLEFPTWAQLTVYRMINGQRCAFCGPKVYWLSAYGRKQRTDLPNEQWQKNPVYMIEKVAEAAALRRAFPEEIGDTPTVEEMEGTDVISAEEIHSYSKSEEGAKATPPRESDDDDESWHQQESAFEERLSEAMLEPDPPISQAKESSPLGVADKLLASLSNEISMYSTARDIRAWWESEPDIKRLKTLDVAKYQILLASANSAMSASRSK